MGHQVAEGSTVADDQRRGCDVFMWASCQTVMTITTPLPETVNYLRKVLQHRGWFNINMTSYQYRNSHCGDKMILRPRYLQNGGMTLRMLAILKKLSRLWPNFFTITSSLIHVMKTVIMIVGLRKKCPATVMTMMYFIQSDDNWYVYWVKSSNESEVRVSISMS